MSRSRWGIFWDAVMNIFFDHAVNLVDEARMLDAELASDREALKGAWLRTESATAKIDLLKGKVEQGKYRVDEMTQKMKAAAQRAAEARAAENPEEEARAVAESAGFANLLDKAMTSYDQLRKTLEANEQLVRQAQEGVFDRALQLDNREVENALLVTEADAASVARQITEETYSLADLLPAGENSNMRNRVRRRIDEDLSKANARAQMGGEMMKRRGLTDRAVANNVSGRAASLLQQAMEQANYQPSKGLPAQVKKVTGSLADTKTAE